MSLDPEIDPDIPALIGASAALGISGVPFNGPIGARRVGYRDGEYLLNPSYGALSQSELNLVVAGTESSVLMVESEAGLLSEEVMLGAVMYGHEQLQTVIENIRQLVADAGTKPWDWQPLDDDTELEDEVSDMCRGPAARSLCNPGQNQPAGNGLTEIRSEAITTITAKYEDRWSDRNIGTAVEELESSIVRGAIVAGEPRIDGRDTATVRDISVEVGVLPRAPWFCLVYPG